MFTASVADDVFTSSRLNGWGFDPEVLYIARKRGYTILELPVEWHYNADSRVRPVHDTVSMVREILSIRIYDWQGVYDA
jgi:dolichyl-phosphate beta-glucosyltransferase